MWSTAPLRGTWKFPRAPTTITACRIPWPSIVAVNQGPGPGPETGLLAAHRSGPHGAGNLPKSPATGASWQRPPIAKSRPSHLKLNQVGESQSGTMPRWPLLADCAGHPGLHGLPSGPLAEAVVRNPQERLNPRSGAGEPAPERGLVGIFPKLSARRLVGAVLAEQPTNGSPPLPHHPQRRRQRGTAGAQYAGRSGLIASKGMTRFYTT